MPTDLPAPRMAPDVEAQVALLSDALATSDAFLVSHVLRKIAAAQGQRHHIGDDPPLSVTITIVQALGLELTAMPAKR